MESKKINQLATELTPALSDLTIIGDPTTGISKKITLSQMASLFTGTVEEYANLAAFPLVGVADTIYIALDTNVLYRWDTGLTSYVELSPNIINSLVFSDANGFDGTISLVGSVATLTITTALTQGSVAFIGASGALSQDNANYFWDNTNKRLGINTNTPTTALDVFGSGIIGRLNGTSTNNAFLGFASAGSNKWSIGNVQSDHRFRIYNEATTSELVSVLSTGEFGIGIANPTTKFHIDGAASALIANLDANVSVAKSISFRSDNSNRINLEVSGTESGSNAGANFYLRTYTDAGALLNTPISITRSTGTATFSSNIGIGITPTINWRSTDKVLQLQKNGILHSQTDANIVGLGVNYYINSSNQFVYSESDFISRYVQYQGQHEFYSAPSGTAGNTVTPTRLMTISQSGNVSIGTTISNWDNLLKVLEIGNAGNFYVGFNGGSAIYMGSGAYYNGGWKYAVTGSGTNLIDVGNGAFTFQNAASGTMGNALTWIDRFKVTSSGTVGINTSTPSGTLDVYASTPTIISNATSSGSLHGLEFRQNNTIDASIKQLPATGELRLSVGRNSSWGGTMTFYTDTLQRVIISSGGRTSFTHSTTDLDVLYVINGSTSPYGMNITFSGAAPNNTTNNFLYFADYSAVRFKVTSNGNAYNQTGTYTSGVSDIRYKEQIESAKSQWNDIKNLRVVNFKFIKDVQENGENALRQIGFIAQEVEKVSPNLIDEMTDYQTGETWKTIKTSIIHTKAIKALQEAMLKIEALEIEVELLKAK